MDDFPYSVKFAVVDSHLIKSKVEPTPRLIRIKNKQSGFYTKLEESILKEGFRNPINVWARPENDIMAMIGGSRLYFAQMHDMMIPCIVSDHINFLPEAMVLNNEEDIRACFKDQPKSITYEKGGVWIVGLEHVHLEDK